MDSLLGNVGTVEMVVSLDEEQRKMFITYLIAHTIFMAVIILIAAAISRN